MAKKTKGWLDNYGEEANANEGSSSAPKGWVGEGYSNVGRNYSPAWGGQFQPGGNLPIASSSSVKRNTLSKIGTDGTNDFTNYATIINSYPDIANDTSYIMNKMGPAGEEQFFYNTNRGKPVVNYNKGRNVVPVSNSISDDLRKEILAGVGGFRQGGSIPGSVGFTYARTKGIPSEGPYAKKTLPSAQNGQEMRYYQEGLDWKPRNISRDGSITKAQKGKKVIIDGKEYDTASEEYKDLYRWGPNDDGRGSIGYFDKNGVLVTNKMTLPEVVVYPKSKSTKQFYEDDLTDGEKHVFDQFTKKYGIVNIEKNEGSGIFSETAGHYNPITNTITINPKANRNSFDTYVAELAHKVQFDKQGKFDVIGDWIFNDLPAYAKRSYYNIMGDRYKAAEASPYEIPGTVENEAHSIYEPKLVDEAIDYYQEDVFGNTYNKYKTGGWLNKYVPEAQTGFELATGIKPITSVTNSGESTSTGVQKRDAKLENDLRIEEKKNKQGQISQGKANTAAQEAERIRKNKIYASTHPYTKIDEQGNLSAAQSDRTMEGKALPNTTAAGIDKGMDHMQTAMDIAGAITGAGELTSLGIKALKNKVVSEGAQNLTSGPSRELLENVNIIHNPNRSDQLAGVAYDVMSGESRVGELMGSWGPDKNFISQSVEILPEFQGKGIGTKAYEQLAKSLPEGSKVVSSGMFNTNNLGYQPGKNLWESLVRSGKAVKLGEGSYKMLKKGGITKAQNGLFSPGVTDFVMPRAASDNTRVSQRDYELEREIALRNKMADQPQLKQDRKQTIAEKKESVRKKKQLVQNNPNIRLDENNDIVLVNPDRGWQGEPLTPNAKRFDKGLGHIMDAIETTGAITGLGSVGTNLLRLGAGALETKIGRNILSRNLKNFTSRVTPTINAIDDASAYIQMDPIGIMGNRVNSQFYNPTVALNTANNTLTGVERNLKNSAVESADLIAGDNNLRNLTGSSVENVTLPKITPEQWKDMSGYLGRRQFVKGLQQEGLIGKGFNLADVNYAARSTDKTNKLTQLALERNNTGFRNVSGKIPSTGIGRQSYTGREFNMNRPAYGQTISEVDNMVNAGVDFNNPRSIAEYQATHIPLEDYGYRSTGEWETPDYGFLFRNPTPTTSLEYGNFQFKSKPNLNFESGNYEDWFNKYYKDLKYHQENPNVAGGPARKENLTEIMPFGKTPNPSVRNATLVGPRGKKAFEIDESFPFINMEDLDSEQLKRLQEYTREYDKQYSTGWRGQYKKGGVVKDNNGYWNPDNWGEVVEIDSPYITMQGVNQPLLGISDTGDVQYMEPGQDYEFDGSKVREYPIPTAQKGKIVRAPIYTDNPTLVENYGDSLNLYNRSRLENLQSEKSNIRDHPTMKYVGYVPWEGLPNTLSSKDKKGHWNRFDDFDYNFKFDNASEVKNRQKNEWFKDHKIKPIGFEIWEDDEDITGTTYYSSAYKKPVQPYILEKEPKLKGKVSSVSKLPIGQPSKEMEIRERQMPNIQSSSNVDMGNYKVDYFDPTEGKDVQGGWHTRSFRSEKEASDFMKQRNADNKFYGPSMTQRVEYKNGGDISIPDLQEGNWLSQYDEGGPGPGDGKINPPIYTNDPNDFRRWQDSGKKYIQGLERLAKARKQIKTSINAYSPLRGLGSLATSASNFFTPGKKIYPKYKEKVVPLKKRWTNDPDENQPISDVEIGDKKFYDVWNHKTILGYSAQDDYNVDTEENDYDFYTDVYQYAPPTRQNLKLLPPPGKKINKPKPKPEPTLKGRVSQVDKLPMGEPSQKIGITQRQMPNIIAPDVEMSGPYMVGYHDYDTQEGIDRGFRTAEERDAFVKELNNRPAGNYQPGLMNVSSYYDISKRKTKKVNQKETGGWLSQYK